jgi:hypothetical protein
VSVCVVTVDEAHRHKQHPQGHRLKREKKNVRRESDRRQESKRAYADTCAYTHVHKTRSTNKQERKKKSCAPQALPLVQKTTSQDTSAYTSCPRQCNYIHDDRQEEREKGKKGERHVLYHVTRAFTASSSSNKKHNRRNSNTHTHTHTENKNRKHSRGMREKDNKSCRTRKA